MSRMLRRETQAVIGTTSAAKEQERLRPSAIFIALVALYEHKPTGRTEMRRSCGISAHCGPFGPSTANSPSNSSSTSRPAPTAASSSSSSPCKSLKRVRLFRPEATGVWNPTLPASLLAPALEALVLPPELWPPGVLYRVFVGDDAAMLPAPPPGVRLSATLMERESAVVFGDRKNASGSSKPSDVRGTFDGMALPVRLQISAVCL